MAKAFKVLFKEIPPANFYTLKFIMKLLFNTTKYTEKNLMGAETLALVFGVNLIRTNNLANIKDPFADNKKIGVITTVMISHYKKVFIEKKKSVKESILTIGEENKE